MQKNCAVLQAHCEGNPPVTGGFPSQRASNAVRACAKLHGDTILVFQITEI